jgi:hypothetical protein
MFIIRWIGIIILACVGNGNDPCSTRPYGLAIYIPNGTTNLRPCLSNEETPKHSAYIRVQSAISSFNWPGRKRCTDGSPCWLFPLHKKDVIRVAGVVDGSGMSARFSPNPLISWKTYVHEKLANDAAANSFATMLVTNGTVKTANLDNGMIIAEGSFPVTGSTVRIVISGTNRYIVVPANSTIDIVNLPRTVAAGVIDTVDHTPHLEHFYLHYALAEKKPATCKGPEPEMAPDKEGFDLVGAIACSNSNYP